MTNRFNGATAKLAQTMAIQPITWVSVTKAARGVLTTAQHTLTIFGLSAVAVLALLYANPDLAKQFYQFVAPEPMPVAKIEAPQTSALMAAAPAEEAEEPQSVHHKAIEGTRKQQEFVTSWLAKRYRVAGDAADMLVSTAYLTASEMKLDPLLILAVMAIESRFNPFAESPVGAQGLMQVMSKVHKDKFHSMGGTQAALNPVANIRVGSQILKEYVTRGGSVEAGLKRYVGAAAFETDSGYGSRVLAEYQRLKLVARGKNVPTFTRPAPATMVADKAAPAAPVAPAPKVEAPVVTEAPNEAIAGL
ncbi:transglycosylase SLT domain-containing protein [Massilia soli]|uniref:Lytic transglycosylase domain-containing protein n=1 Tax=Massilia soli TaxID=2792854 RepID=A0ABS7SM07_9BURK|nr:lytic transglycosylase domain-containing protein [Massilia soli]